MQYCSSRECGSGAAGGRVSAPTWNLLFPLLLYRLHPAVQLIRSMKQALLKQSAEAVRHIAPGAGGAAGQYKQLGPKGAATAGKSGRPGARLADVRLKLKALA